MRNIKITIEYDGTDFHGWQIQDKGKRTVQGEIEKALFRIFKRRTKVIGSGRTDSGVHAQGQVANFRIESSMIPLQMLKALNALLPEDIAIKKAEEVVEKFHAQYSVKSKIYRYTISNHLTRSPLCRNYCFHYTYPLNLSLMRKEAKLLVGRKDFKSFQVTGSPQEPGPKNTIRTIKKIEIKKRNDVITIAIEADGFLYKMVRSIVGTLLAVASGRLPAGSMKKILKAKNRMLAGQTAPAKGLCLVEVKY